MQLVKKILVIDPSVDRRLTGQAPPPARLPPLGPGSPLQARIRRLASQISYFEHRSTNTYFNLSMV